MEQEWEELKNFYGGDDVENYYREFHERKLDKCPLLTPGSELSEWFENPNTYENEIDSVYPKDDGGMEPAFLEQLFFTMEHNMVRLARYRCQPQYTKEVGDNMIIVPKLPVGHLQERQWNEYKKRKLANEDRKPKPGSKKVSKPGFNWTLKERIEFLQWKAPRSELDFPVLAGQNRWFVLKWTDGKRIWRAWLVSFYISWNSFTGQVGFGMRYRCQHHNIRAKRWIAN
jgi:hypothetical protein